MLQVKDASTSSLWPALSALVTSAVAAYALVFWVLQIQSLGAPASHAPVVVTSSNNASSETGGNAPVAWALGSTKAENKGQASASAHQWNLLGVVAGESGQGSALIAVDGQPAKAFLPGQNVAPGWVLHSVGNRLARLAPGLNAAPTLTLELPPSINAVKTSGTPG